MFSYCLMQDNYFALLLCICHVCTLFIIIKPQSNGPSYRNTVIGTLAVDGWAVWYSEEETGRVRSPPSLLLAVPNVTTHPSTASVPTSCYSMLHYNCFWSLKG